VLLFLKIYQPSSGEFRYWKSVGLPAATPLKALVTHIAKHELPGVSPDEIDLYEEVQRG